MRYTKNGVLVGLTPQMKTLMNDFNDEKKSSVLEAIKELLQYRDLGIKKMGFSFAECARQHHQLIDMQLEQANIKENTSCKAGCAYCCEMDVAINSDEAELLLEYANKNNITIDTARLERQSNIKCAWHDQPKGDRTCIFLGGDNLCKVYPVRPASCRKYLAKVDDIEECNLAHGIRDVRLAVSGVVEIIASAMLNMGEQGRLCQMILKLIKAKPVKDTTSEALSTTYPGQ
jgi:uncharacterized protein